MLITIANKLKRSDSLTGQDVWYKTHLEAVVKVDKVETVVGTEVSMGNAYTILIPFSDKYVHYRDWTDRDNTYTMTQGDIIFLGEVEEDITPTSIVQLKKSYDFCEVRSIEEREQKHGVKTQLRVSGV